jgi:hypothetical protein
VHIFTWEFEGLIGFVSATRQASILQGNARRNLETSRLHSAFRIVRMPQQIPLPFTILCCLFILSPLKITWQIWQVKQASTILGLSLTVIVHHTPLIISSTKLKAQAQV